MRLTPWSWCVLFGGTGLWPMIALSNIAQGSAVVAYYFIKRHDEREAQISLPPTISSLSWCHWNRTFWVVNVKYVYPLVAGMSASALSGLLSAVFGVQANSIGISGLRLFSQLNLNIGQSLRLL